MLSEYDTQAAEVLQKVGATIEVSFLELGKHFKEDKEPRLRYTFTIRKGSRFYTGTFGASLKDTEEALLNLIKNQIRAITALGLAAGYPMFQPLTGYFLELVKQRIATGNYCLGSANNLLKKAELKKPSEYDILTCLTKYDPGTFENFCSDYGYDDDSIIALEIYEELKEEYQGLAMVFNDEELCLLSEVN